MTNEEKKAAVKQTTLSLLQTVPHATHVSIGLSIVYGTMATATGAYAEELQTSLHSH